MNTLVVPVLSGLLLAAAPAAAADLVSAAVVTDRIVVLEIRDGKGIYPGPHETSPERIEEVRLDVQRAARPDAWTIRSADDPAFRQGLRPVKVGRKSKGRDCVTETVPAWKPRMTLEHRIYLVLSKPMQPGKSYSIGTGNLVANARDTTVRFEPRRTRSEAVHASQIGYTPDATVKTAYVSHWLGDLGPLDLAPYAPGRFHLADRATGATVFAGALTLRKKLSATPAGGDGLQPDEPPWWRTDVWEADFSAFRGTGEFVVAVDGLGASFPFRIHPDVYREPFLKVLKGMYQMRCGTALVEPYTKWTRSVCHHPAQGPIVQSKIRRMDRQCDACQDVEATGERRNIWGGYHDAGDWDREPGHVEVPLVLSLAYELNPSAFHDGEGNIPESGNGFPDLLDEAKWGLDYYARVQRPDGGVSAGLFLDSFPDPGEGPAWDTGKWYCYAEEPEVSYKYAAAACAFAAAAARAGRPEWGMPYIESAKRAWNWAGANLRPGDEPKIRDARHWAAAGLYRMTGARPFHDAFVRDLRVATDTTDLAVWGEYDQTWSCWTWALTDRPYMDLALKERVRRASIHNAKVEWLDTAARRTSRTGGDLWLPFHWGRGADPETHAALAAWRFSGDPVFLSVARTTADAMLGANPLSMCWITGTGSRSPEMLFHPDSWYSPMGPVVAPGLIPEGPYKFTGPADGKADTGPWSTKWVQASAYPDPKHWPPLELYFECRTCYPMNEFTIRQMAGAAASYGALCAGPAGSR